jgi:hypothetical protein
VNPFFCCFCCCNSIDYFRDVTNGAGYTLIWSRRQAQASANDASSTQMNDYKATELRIALSGVHPSIGNDLRKRYYSIGEWRVIARFAFNLY